MAAANEIALGVKAAFLYNFTKFIEWPASAADTNGRFNLCIAASLADTRQIERVVNGKSTQDKSIDVRFVSERGQLSDCHMLYSSGEAPYWSEQWLRETVTLPLVTVGEGEDFIERGGVIGLIIVDGKVRFVIHEARAREQGIVISSKLLSLAQRVVR
ncbi:hypothetical protein FHR99_000927 [Litorivivens lipolytica]|uniref:Transmembrane protein n=1 Tax=Litorivivens lipolytica TaxID=1524264 RepID=A0A7W4W3C7_9GAMM|nr:YfiR family protein [Litorivivens lipolytica]MBB3046691.1 hypothetical protein [Litorivivens lipolytica]